MDKYSTEPTGFGDNENHGKHERDEYENVKICRGHDRIEEEHGCGVQSRFPSVEGGRISRYMQKKVAEDDREPEAKKN